MTVNRSRRAARLGGTQAGSASAGGPGIVFASSAAPAVGINFYDGRFLRADDLNLEHASQRAYVDYSNRAAGSGVAYGFDFLADGEEFTLTSGLAIDRGGKLIYLPSDQTAGLASLFREQRGAPGSASPGFAACDEVLKQPDNTFEVAGSALYVVWIGRSSQLTGESEVLGRLCDEGCAAPTDRPYVVDGVAVWVTPLKNLDLATLPGVTSAATHLRSQVATAYFADELDTAGSLLFATGLRMPAWCRGAAPNVEAQGVAIAVLGWNGSALTLLDGWTARRELMDMPPRHYWNGRMELRPWSVFMAQVLQFQCQLADSGLGVKVPGLKAKALAQGADELGDAWTLVDELAATLSKSAAAGERRITPEIDDRVRALQKMQAMVKAGGVGSASPSPRSLVEQFVTVPSAGYLPVTSRSATGLREELQTLMGAGVDLRLCAVRRDQVPHELERAQHMDRISLLQGLAHTDDKERVDVLVPDGVPEDCSAVATGRGFAVDVALGLGRRQADHSLGTEAAADSGRLLLQGLGRFDWGDGITVRAAVGATSTGTLKPLADVLMKFAGSNATWAETVDGLAAMEVGAAPLSVDLLREVGANAAVLTARHRLGNARGRVIAVSGTGGRVTAMSATVWVARDPFSMQEAASTAFHAEWDMNLPAFSSQGVGLVADGRAQRLSGATSFDGAEVVVRVTGVVDVTNAGGPATPQTRSFSTTLVFRRGRPDDQDLVSVRDEASTWVAAVRWPTHAAQASGGLAELTAVEGVRTAEEADAAFLDTVLGKKTLRPKGGARAIAMFGVREDKSIYEPGNTHRDSAIAALKILSSLHFEDASFVDRSYRDLVPAAGTTGRQTLIRPRLDWVLFRRRRWTECEGSTDVLGTSVVALWVVRASDPEEADAWRGALTDSGDVPWPHTPVDLVLFDAGSSVMRTSAAQIRQQLSNADVGDRVRFAGYANAPGSTEAPVADARAHAVVDACAPLTTLDAKGEIDLVPAPPPGQMLSDTEGSIFLITYQADGVEVIVVDGVSQGQDELLNAVRKGEAAVVTKSGPEKVPRWASADDVGSLGDTMISDLGTRLAALQEKLGKPREKGAKLEGVAWLQQGIAGERRDRIVKELGRITPGLGLGTFADTQQLSVDFAADDGPPVRIFALVV